MDSIKIAGAGPAGLSAAINLAQQGYQVEVFEKNSDVGGRFHGEFQGLENWSDKKDSLFSLKKMNISINFKYHPFKDLSISNGKRRWDFKCNKPAFYLINRGSLPGSLDTGLKDQAEDKGVEIHFNIKLPEKEADIIATGPNYQERFAVAQGIVFQTDMEDLALGLVNDETAIKGYSYLLVAKKMGTMGTVLFDNFQELNRCFSETHKTYYNLVDLDIKKPRNIGGMGSFSTQNIFKKNERLYVGESAGLQDLLWGFGIKMAIKSGFMAAESIVNHEDYEIKAMEHFSNKLKASLVNRYFWEKFSGKNYSFIVNRINKSQDHLQYLNRFYNFNLLQRIMYPFALMYMRNRYGNLRF